MTNYLPVFENELIRRHIGQTRVVTRRVAMTANSTNEFEHSPDDESAIDVAYSINLEGFATDATTEAAVHSEETNITPFVLEPSTGTVPIAFYSEVSKRNPLRVVLRQAAGTPTVNYTLLFVHVEKDQLGRFNEFKAAWNALIDQRAPPPGSGSQAIRWTARPARAVG